MMDRVLNFPALVRARAALSERARTVWESDRAGLRVLPALGRRAARITVLVARGIIKHRLGLQAAALTYYSVFAMVPLLVVVSRALKLLDHLPTLPPQRLPASAGEITGNQLLQVALGNVLDAVNRTSELTSSVVGLVALLFAVSKMFGYSERALHIIAASGQRKPRLVRLLGYVALLLMPAVVLAVSGLLLALTTGFIVHDIARGLRSIPGVELAAGGLVAFAVLWAAVAIFYVAAARARIPFASAALGSALAALALLVVFWAFTAFQIGVAQAGAVGAGFLAFPIFLLWIFSCWSVVLVGAEIAVAHRVDRVLLHGARAFQLDAVGQRQAAAAVMVLLTRAARSQARTNGVLNEDDLARTLRLPPNLIYDLCVRLAERGLLSEGPEGFSLVCDPASTTLAVVIDAIERDPTLDAVHEAGLAQLCPPAGPLDRDATLRQLA